MALLALRRRWPAQLAVGFDQVALLLLLNLTLWGLLDKVHADPHAPFELGGGHRPHIILPSRIVAPPTAVWTRVSKSSARLR